MENDTNSYATEFAIIEFTNAELKLLNRDEQEFILSASLILNDVRFHWAILGRTTEDAEDETLKTMQMVRAFWALRKLASVIFEANNILGTYVGKISLLKDLVRDGNSVLAATTASSNYLPVAQILRNRTAFHYGLGELADHIAEFEDETIHRMYPHKQHGNSISGICEQILTAPAILNSFPGASVNGFQNWCMTNSNSIVTFCNKALGKIITHRFPDKKYSKVEIELGEEAAKMSRRWPLFTVIDMNEVKGKHDNPSGI